MDDRIIADPVNGGQADSAFWNVNDSFGRDIIHAIFNGTQISKNILDLLALVKVDGTNDAVGDIVIDQLLLEDTGLGVGAVQYGKVLVRSLSVFYGAGDGRGNCLRFLIFILKLGIVDGISFVLAGPESLFFTFCIIVDHSVGCIQDILSGAVIFFQTDDTGIRILLLKVQNIHNIGTTEFIDGLVIITYDAEVVLHTTVFGRSTCHQTDQLKLCGIGILILIYHNVAETVLVIRQNVLIFLKHLDRLADQIIEIQGIGIPETFFIFLIGAGIDFPHFVALCSPGIFFGTDQFVLRIGNYIQESTFLVFFGIQIKKFDDFPHQGALIVGIIYRKASFITQYLNITAQDPDTGRMEGTDPDIFGAVAHDLVHTFSHFAGSLVGEGQCQNVIRIYIIIIDQIGNAVCENSCFTGAGTGKDQKRSLKVLYGFFLLGI